MINLDLIINGKITEFKRTTLLGFENFHFKANGIHFDYSYSISKHRTIIERFKYSEPNYLDCVGQMVVNVPIPIEDQYDLPFAINEFKRLSIKK